MFYPQNVIEDVRTGVDIVNIISSYVKLEAKGGSYFGLCPFHNEKTPSFSVSRNKQLYHCFGCGASGNVFTFVMQAERIDFGESIKFLADRINYKLPETSDFNSELHNEKNLLYEIHIKSARFYHDLLFTSQGFIALDYLNNRQMSKEMISKFGIGFGGLESDGLYKALLNEGYDIETILKSGLVIKNQNNNSYFDRFSKRVIFPIFDVQKRVVGFGGRILDENKKTAKYLNSPETLIFDKSKNLYGINFAKNSKHKELILVEGYMDVISLFQYGFDNAIASLGTAFNENHVRSIRKYTENVAVLFDNDQAGINATLKAIPILTQNGLKVKIILLDKSKDPDEFLKKNGQAAFQKSVNESLNYIDFLIKIEKEKYNLNNVSEKVEFTKAVTLILSKLNDAVEKDAYIKSVASMTGIDANAIKADISKISTVTNTTTFVKKAYSNIDKEKKSVLDAKKSLLTIILKNKKISEIVSNYIEPTEMDNPTYEKLLTLILGFHKEDKVVCEADVINFFQTIDEQKMVSDVFNTSVEFNDSSKTEKVVNDLVKLIKKEHMDKTAANTTDISIVQKIINERKKLDRLYISLN